MKAITNPPKLSLLSRELAQRHSGWFLRTGVFRLRGASNVLALTLAVVDN